MFEVEEGKIIYKENHETVGWLEFTYVDSKTVDIIHTFVNPEHRGKGIAKQLVAYALEYFESKHLHVKYTCSYAKKHERNQ